MRSKDILKVISISLAICSVGNYVLATLTNSSVAGLLFIGCMMGFLFFYNELQKPLYNY